MLNRIEAILDLKEKLLIAEEKRLNGEKTTSLDSAYQRIKERVELLPTADADLDDIFNYILLEVLQRFFIHHHITLRISLLLS